MLAKGGIRQGAIWLPWVATALAALFGSVFFSLYGDPLPERVLIDFYKAYLAAGDAVLRGDNAAFLSLIEGHLFVNVPIVAWFFVPFAALGHFWAGAVFTAIGAAAVAATIAILTQGAPANLRLGIVALFFLNGPLWYSLWMGNATHIVLLCLVLGLVLWRKDWLYSAGLLFGLAAIIKPMLALFGVYFLWKREWRVVAGGATIVAGALLGGIAVYGVHYTVSWYENDIVYFARRPIGAYNSQSLSNFLLRLQTGPAYLHDWHPKYLSLASRIARDIIMAAMGLAVALTILAPRGAPKGSPPSSREYAEISLLIVFCVMTSTISWTHYYLLLLLPWALYFTGRMPLCDDMLTRVLLWASIALCSFPVHYNIYSPGLPAVILPRILDSVWFIGAACLFWAISRAVIRQAEWRVSLAGLVKGKA